MDFQTLKPVSLYIPWWQSGKSRLPAQWFPYFVQPKVQFVWSKMTRTKVDSRILSNEPLLESTVGQTPQCSINYNVALWLCRLSAALIPTQQNIGQGASSTNSRVRGRYCARISMCCFIHQILWKKIARTLVSSCRILCSMGLSCLVRLLDRLVNTLTVATNVSHYYNSFLTNSSIVLSNIGHSVPASVFNY